LKKEQEKIPENEEKKQPSEVSRRDFLVGAGTVVVGGAIGAGLLSGCGETVTTTVKETSTKTVPTTITAPGTTVTETKTVPGEGGQVITVTETRTITEPGGGGIEPWQELEETFVLQLGPSSSCAGAVDCKNGKIIRMRGLHYNEKYTDEELVGTEWSMEAKHRKTGETISFKSRDRSGPSYLSVPYKKRVYSPNRVLYPLKRVDWEPGGDPAKINAQNRGKSKFKRISWDEATDIIASEIKRVQDKYGVYGVLDKSDSCHRENKGLTGSGCAVMVSGLLQIVGATMSIRNADSWEGWYYGAMHVWGTGQRGCQSPAANLTLDIAENCDMIVYQGCDWDTTAAIAGGYASRVARWYNKLGIKQVYISPEVNFQNASNPDKWIPVLPLTDVALDLGIIYTWIDEDTYDKEYIATHSVGFDDYIKPYVMGETDGIPKTPAWAAKKCGVPECTIKALARKWAKSTVSCVHHLGGARIRGPYCHEDARYECVMLGMQGLGRPGVNQHGLFVGPAVPGRLKNLNPGAMTARFSNIGASATPPFNENMKQVLSKDVLARAIIDGHAETWGSTAKGAQVEDQFVYYQYPIPAAEGGTEFHLIWSDANCHIACWNDGYKYIHAIRNPKIECYINQCLWMENDTLYSDIILPVTTNCEEEDLLTAGREISMLVYKKKLANTVGEGMSDYEIAAEVAKKLEKYGGRYEDLYNKYTGGKTIDEWFQFGYDNSGASAFISFEDLKEKGYYIPPTNPDWAKQTRGLIKFYEDPTNNPLITPTGKLEFYSQRLADNFPDDKERPPYPQYVTGGPESEGWTHDESLDVENGAQRCEKYPLLIQVNHTRWRLHVQNDDIPWVREIPTCKMEGPDGYMYEPAWINPIDAEARGIEHGDIIKVYNNRGIELACAYVTERVIKGAIHMDHGARLDPIRLEESEFNERETKWINRSGTLNVISPEPGLSEHCPGMVVSGYLVEVAKLSGDEMNNWRKENPESFTRDYDPAYGPLASGWIEGGD